MWLKCTWIICFISPLPENRGDFRFPRRLSFCPSVCPSVHLSVSPSVRQSTRSPSTRFSELFFSRPLRYWLTIWYMDLSWHNTDHALLVPYRWNRGDFRFPRRLSFCPSVHLSVCPSVHSVSVHSVFRTFLSRPLRYWLTIWYMDLSWHNTDQDWLLSRLTYFFLSHCPLQKLSFPNFSLSSFVMLTWNLVYEFVLT